MGMSGLFVPCMIAVYDHAYVYWFAQGLWGIGWNGFGDFAIEFFLIHNWELIIINMWIGWIHA